MNKSKGIDSRAILNIKEMEIESFKRIEGARDGKGVVKAREAFHKGKVESTREEEIEKGMLEEPKEELRAPKGKRYLTANERNALKDTREEEIEKGILEEAGVDFPAPKGSRYLTVNEKSTLKKEVTKCKEDVAIIGESTEKAEKVVRRVLSMHDCDLKNTIITPSAAKTILEWHNNNNRKVSTTIVARYSDDMINDKWKESNDNITFDDTWMLSNGQHRLRAIVTANKPIKMVVQFHVNQNCEMDRGKQRTISENIRLSGIVDNEELKNDVRVHTIINTMLRSFNKLRSTRTEEVANMINEFEEELIDIKSAGLLCGAAGVNQAAIQVAMFMAYINGVDLAVLSHIRSVINDGVATAPTDKPIIGCRDRLINIHGGGVYVNSERIKYTQYCIRAYLMGKTTKVCKCTDVIYELKRTKDVE